MSKLRRVAAGPRKVARVAVGLVKPGPYDPKHPEPAARAVAPAEGVVEPGEPLWSINNGGREPSNDQPEHIGVYATATSVPAGGTIGFAVTVNPPQPFTVEVVRIGAQTVSVLSAGPVDGSAQPVAVLAGATRTITCDWTVTWTLEVPAQWSSGLYVAKVRRADGYQFTTPFVVRDDTRAPDVLVMVPFPTYQAYNEYPKDFYGASLYYAYDNGAIFGEDKAATKVSFDRPYHRVGAPANFDIDTSFARWVERWAEQNGKTVGYADSGDLHDGTVSVDAARTKAVVFPGHDEYWSLPMRHALEKIIADGVSVAFLAANNAYWQIRFEDGRRTVVCYKNRPDPGAASPALRTARWRDIGEAEQKILGGQYVSTLKGTAPLVVDNAGHWFWEGTGVRDGERIPHLLWGECDQVTPWTPKPEGIEFLAASPYTGRGRPQVQHTVLRRTEAGGWVFLGGTFNWAKGLAAPGVADSRIQRATANLLAAMTA